MRGPLGRVAVSAFALVLALSAVPGSVHAAGAGEEQANVIGIAKIVAHPALDAVEKGVMEELKEQGYEVEFDLQNANGDMTTASSIANKFKTDRVSLAVGIATPTSQALANTLDDIPVVYSAVTDPVDAGLVESYEQGGDNITGVSDMTPVKEQLQFFKRVAGVERLGHVYSSGEANAVRLAEMAKEAAEELDMEFIESTVTNSAEVRQAAQSIVDKVDGIYVSTDNTVVSALNSLVSVADRESVPVMSADPSSAEKYGVLAAWGFDYYQVGRATGKIVARILDGTDPAEIPTKFMTDRSDIDLLINRDVADRLGISFPDDVVELASTIVEDGEVKRK
jgi:putative ABC transport system substrate-binding protein